MKTEPSVNVSKLIDVAFAMTTDQLDDWYLEHVGYRLTDDDPALLCTPQHAEQVAEMMCLHKFGEDSVEYGLLLAKFESATFYS